MPTAGAAAPTSTERRGEAAAAAVGRRSAAARTGRPRDAFSAPCRSATGRREASTCTKVAFTVATATPVRRRPARNASGHINCATGIRDDGRTARVWLAPATRPAPERQPQHRPPHLSSLHVWLRQPTIELPGVAGMLQVLLQSLPCLLCPPILLACSSASATACLHLLCTL